MKLSLTLLVVLIVYRTTEIDGIPLSDKQHNILTNQKVSQELDDFISVIPVQKIQKILYEHLICDDDFGNSVDYVLSNEFQSECIKLLSNSEFQDLLKFLQDSGLNLNDFYHKMIKLIKTEKIHPFREPKCDMISGGLSGFVQDIQTELPIDKIQQMYEEKSENSINFAVLMEQLQSEQFKLQIKKLLLNTDLINIVDLAEQNGVDVQTILDLFFKVSGLKFPSESSEISSRNLKDDLQDFMHLIPKEKIQDLFLEYLTEDEDFGEAMDYVMSDEFKSLITEVEGMDEVVKLLRFLQDSGLNAYGFINKINEILGIEKITPPSEFLGKLRISGGLPGFIRDVKALLPVEKIRELYRQKLTNSKDFATLIERLESKEFQGLVDRLMANSKLEDLMKRAEAKGVDVQAILDFFTRVLGLKFPHRPHVSFYGNLKDDLQDFMQLIPKEKIQDLFLEYLTEDEDFGEAMDYVMSDEFKSLITEVEGMDEVVHLLLFLQESGLNAYGFVNKINDILGIEKIAPPNEFQRKLRISGGLPGFIRDVKALLPVEKIRELYKYKLANSKDFATLIQRLESKEFQGLVDRLMANPKLQNLMQRAEAKGVDVQAILDFFTRVLGLKFPHRPHVSFYGNLKDDLQDFMQLIPKDKIQDLFLEYLTEDEDFGEAMDYVMSDEFKSLITEVEGMDEVVKLLHFLQDSGLNAYGFINKINDILGIEKITPPSEFLGKLRISGGLPGFIRDVKALLPVEKIRELYRQKLTNSKDFATLIKRLESKEFQGLVDKLMANSKLEDLMKRAEAKGVDVQAILDFFTRVLGLKFPHRPHVYFYINLKNDLQDFMHLIPKDKIQEIFLKYLTEDEDFGESMDYVMSDEFKSLITEVEGMDEVEHLLHFLQDSGLNAYGFINEINDILGIDRITPPSEFRKEVRFYGGVSGFIREVKALLPVDKIRELYKYKLANSKDFVVLIEHLKSKEFQGLVDKLMANPKLQNLMNRAEAKGINVQAVFDFFTRVLGLKFPHRPSQIKFSSQPGLFKEEEVIDILHVIWSKVPMDNILELMVDYLVEDTDFKRVVKYILSDEFKVTLVDIEEISEIKLLLKFLDETDVDVYKWINDFHSLIGLEKTLPSEGSYMKISGGIPGLIHDIRSQLPIIELRGYYNEKLKTSNKFKNFIQRLEKRELQNAVDALNKHQGFNVLLNKLEAMGVDWNEVVEVISAIIGIKFPDRPY